MHTALVSLEVTVSLRVVSGTVILSYNLFELVKLVSVEDAPSAQLRSATGEHKYPRMLMVLGSMENSFDGA